MARDDYILTVGLEIHAELKTRTKMFCNSKNDPDETRPNWNVCPICMGHPGTLPVINREAVKHVLKVGVALGGMLADFTEFDRKNYFYPDIPKGYQLSQYAFPLVTGGGLNGVAITRVHLEEDTATSLHEEGNYSLIDFNRAGVPLLELVTEPVIHSAKQAADFPRELQIVLRCLGASDANMEKGEMRVEANISVALATEIADLRGLHADQRRQSENVIQRQSAPRLRSSAMPLGTKVEVKNLNSFRAVERAIVYEYHRQVSLLESGKKVAQETRGWNEDTQETFSQRRKEESHDYRYFPDPDIPKLLMSKIPEFALDVLKKEMPELPMQKRERYLRDYHLKMEDAEVFIGNRALGRLFEESARALRKPEVLRAANYLTSDLMGLLKKKGADADSASFAFDAPAFASLISMAAGNKISSRGAKDILSVMFENGGTPEEIARERGLLQQSDEASLRKIAEGIIAANQSVVNDYKKGKPAALQFFIGQGMKATKGAANPEMLREIFISLLK